MNINIHSIRENQFNVELSGLSFGQVQQLIENLGGFIHDNTSTITASLLDGGAIRGTSSIINPHNANEGERSQAIDLQQAQKELLKPVSFHTFYMAIKAATTNENAKNAAFVHVYGIAEYADMRCFLSPNRDYGYAIKGGDIVSVFKNPNSSVKSVMDAIMKSALDNGGYKLDCFDGYLPKQYKKYGFVEYDRMSWNDEYAPSNWNYTKDGRPDVVFMALTSANEATA